MANCPKCHQALTVGEWPFCPHGKPEGFNIIGDETDIWVENMGKHPRHFRSKAEHRRTMKELGLRHPERYVPHPQGKNQARNGGVPDTRCADEYTMNYKRELLERAFQQPARQRQSAELVRWDIHDMSKAEAAKYIDE